MSAQVRIGIIREGKTPPDKRTPFTPAQCKLITEKYPHVEVFVQPSPHRAYKDEEYAARGATIQEDLSNCDILMGIKEVPKQELIAGKKYLYFSHTIKEQPYNQQLLRKMLDLNIQMIDYECLTYDHGGRILGFGRYAGIVGAYNALRGYGIRKGLFSLKPANECYDYAELKEQLKNVQFDQPVKIVLTGLGRVGGGAIEVMEHAGVKEVSYDAYLNDSFEGPVFAKLSVCEYNKKSDGSTCIQEEFFSDPDGYESDFMRFAVISDIYIACHFWDSAAPFIFTRDDMKHPEWKIDMVGDVSCDIDGPVACTLRPSTIADPFYGYDPASESEVGFDDAHIGVMAVDNLPCELPRDASEDFGQALIEKVLDHLVNEDREGIIEGATICKDGQLTEQFAYLSDYAAGN